MCDACNASYYIYFFPFKKPLAKEIVMKRSRSVAHVQNYWDLKNYSSTQNGCLQRRANGKNVNHVLMK
jgi:hypothetical protein